ncbi:hypothetical protein LEP1GSC041_2618 [Leptospira noguchii str. 2006001870]|nr:hypothetical protein LEP1GSC041_2618 [Leptospira noguchii str. 2006001870]
MIQSTSFTNKGRNSLKFCKHVGGRSRFNPLPLQTKEEIFNDYSSNF